MSFVPVTGPATFRVAQPPRDSVIEFSDDQRTVPMPMRAALPVLTRAHARDDLHPSVRLLSGAALLGMRLVAAGKFAPHAEESSWRITELDSADHDRVTMLARARAHGELDVAEAARIVHDVLDAVADTLPRSGPTTRSSGGSGGAWSGGARRPPRPAPRAGAGAGATGGADPAFAARLRARIEKHRTAPPDDRPQLVGISLRIEADEEELVAGAVRVVPQVHDERNPLHVCDAALLWTEPDGPGAPASHGFGDRARTHAGIALRAAAQAWAPLERLLEQPVPDDMTLDTDELVSLLEEGVGSLRAGGVDVLWPRSLGRDLTAETVLDRVPRPGQGREAPLQDGVLSGEAMFAFTWQIALHGDPLTEEEMDQLAAAAGPVLRLRGNWMVVDPATARKARGRLVRTVKPVQAVAAALTGVVRVDDLEEKVVVGASLLRVRERLQDAAVREPVPPPAGLAAELRDYQRHGLTWLAELTGLGLGACLADDMGLGKTITLIALHLHRVETARSAGRRVGPTLVVCPASLLGNWEAEIRRFAPGVPVRRFHGGRRSLAGLEDGFVLTTYGTMRRSVAPTGPGSVDPAPVDPSLVDPAPVEPVLGDPVLPGLPETGPGLADVDWDLVVADEAQHVKNARSSTARALRHVPGTARVALTGTPVENDLSELWAILDWTTPGLLGSRNAFRKVWAAPIESGLEPTKARQFADLISPFLLRRRKSDPGIAPELPAKTETDHQLSLTREQVVLYEAFVRDTMDRIERAGDEATRRGLVLALLTGLKQICNHPAHFLKQSTARLAGRSEKIDLLDELLATVLSEGGAVLVFTQYVAMARLLEAHLSRTGVPHQFLHGGTPVPEREAMVARFQAGPDDPQHAPVFLLSLKAGGTGLNLTRADHVVHLDRWWNPAVEEQATDRAHRIGQTKPVQVHRMVTHGTIEEKIAELLARKRALADAVLARGEAALTELSDDDLRDFVSLRRGAPTEAEE